MAETPLLTLTDITLGFGGRPLFTGVNLALGAGERACVVGRNGSGKSTLLKISAGLVEPDGGTRWVQPGARIAYLPQDPDPTGFATLGDYVAADLPETERWRAEAAMEGLQVGAAADPATASGGERRRAALARLIAGEPDLMLLDEPTNHLDIAAIEWLENHLSETRTGFAVISHDRAFLARLTRSTLWLDRGEVRRNPQGFAAFEDWREKIWAEEDAARHKLDRLIAQEAHWAVYGISARRTRNQGRLRRLETLRAERRAQISRQGPAAMALESSAPSGKRVIEAEGIAKTYDGREIFRDFSIRIGRGERVALVGPNGAGKTTLLKVLTGQIAPDSGEVRLGTNIEMAVFDQNRAALDPARSLWETLTEDKLTRVSGASDQVMVRGRPRHVVAYLKDFLFDERQARGPVGALSGGEKARLLLARIMARPSNLLVLDEPTNDLDVETLDLLQELIEEFDGTVLLVSHDRDFLDRVATTTIAMEGDGRATVYAGGWSDYRAQRGDGATARPAPAPEPGRKPQAAEAPRAARKLSYRQERRLADLPAEIERLTAEIGKLEELLSDAELYSRDPVKFAKATEMLDERRGRLDAAETEWLELEELRESLAAE
ncbi:ATP-binding cassette domain-containing protein [Limibaculum sp. M0105]|uniref:ATP-binding protein Uup n=1 Tax=Thermohalobaculum xanthum TaxID=2753746 RepID=A0A8J7M5H3_9RHOB|nr:ATP-binding cassette domain-containing protein [Thermohalobaculum xanthum]MBK0398809.1 ATP-binding cassette domain-containing protein [Thermohalobaculum xanthum]